MAHRQFLFEPMGLIRPYLLEEQIARLEVLDMDFRLFHMCRASFLLVFVWHLSNQGCMVICELVSDLSHSNVIQISLPSGAAAH